MTGLQLWSQANNRDQFASVYDSFQDIRYVSVFPLQFRQPDPTKAEAKAVFANLGWETTDKLSVKAGARYTDE